MQKPVRMTQNYDKKNILKIKIYLFTKTKASLILQKKNSYNQFDQKFFLIKIKIYHINILK